MNYSDSFSVNLLAVDNALIPANIAIRSEEFPKLRNSYGSVTMLSWLLLQKANAPFTRSTRAPTYKATEITISNMAQII